MRLLTSILFVITSVTFIFSQNKEVELSTNALSFDVGEPITITVKSTVQGMIDIDFPSAFVHGYDMVSGMEQDMDANTGQITTIYYLSQTGAISKAGKYTLGPAFIKKGNKTYVSNSVTVTIGNKIELRGGDVTTQQLKDPAFGVITTNKNKIYEGEPLIAAAKVYSTYEPTHIDGYHTYNIGTLIDKHSLNTSNRNTVRQERFKGRNFYSFEYDKNVLFPTSVGKLSFSPFKMNVNQDFQGYTVLSGSKQIEVLPLPNNAPSDFISGVGEFNVNRTIEDTLIEQGGVMKLTITVSGTGNIHNLTEPPIHFPSGFVIYGDPIVEEDFTFCSLGAQGTITYKYNIQINQHGELIVPANSISYFDPKKEKYVTIQTSSDTIIVKKNKQYVAHKENGPSHKTEEISIYPDLAFGKRPVNRDRFYNSPVYWTTLSSPILFAFAFIFFKKVKRKSVETTVEKNILKSIDSNKKTLSELAQSKDDLAFYKLAEETIIALIEKSAPMSFGKSRIKAIDYLSTKDAALAERVTKAFEDCDLCKYGMGDTSSFETLQPALTSIIETLKTLK